jgi:hypothetical protein
MRLTALIFVLFLTGCATGQQIRNNVQPGMSVAQVSAALGRPDGVSTIGEFTVYTYANRLVSGWAWDRADYHIVMKDDKVVQYGPGTIRPGSNNVVLIIPPPR